MIAEASAAVAGRSGGISFAIGERHDDDRSLGEDAETTAYRVAAADALAKCVAML